MALNMYRSLLIVCVFVCNSVCSSVCNSVYGIQDAADSTEPGSLQSNVVLQMMEGAEISSIVVRVRDVVRPAGRAPEGWDRIAGATIALLPSDGRRLRIERQRLVEALHRSRLLQEPVRWSGPEYTAVQYVAPVQLLQSPVLASTSNASQNKLNPSTANDGQIDDRLSVHTVGMSGATTSLTAVSSPLPELQVVGESKKVAVGEEALVSTLLPAERNRLQRISLSAFEKTHKALFATYEIVMDADQPGIDALKGLRTAQYVRLMQEPADGVVKIEISGKSDAGDVVGQLEIELAKLPTIVVVRSQLNRGDILTMRDLELKPWPRSAFRPEYLQDIESLVGLEVIRGLTPGRPVVSSDVSVPLIIQRGDQVELRVVGAGVTVSTNARALAPAAAGESVMVETESPRKKIAGRAVRAGVVEIVTRPPSVGDESRVSSAYTQGVNR
jgi:flagella basal body P-ring formation protein FlgA